LAEATELLQHAERCPLAVYGDSRFQICRHCDISLLRVRGSSHAFKAPREEHLDSS